MTGESGESGRGAELLLLADGAVQRHSAESYGMDMVQEVARLLGSPNIRSTVLGENLTLWHAEAGGGSRGFFRRRSPEANALANRLASEHGSSIPVVAGPAVVSGPMLYGSPYPLDAAEADALAAYLAA
ncbi:hypothetical protein BIV57_05255 [Mangrovactinospora gilvigrisea]|uniref:Uncharacterized protein n=1 Tax=Mangrovactinospora gilvigrisea TaxID=1428644 RepID=A0A1J7BIS9_9ACTN|nr:hypothetical protein [Mangrovactinospora gilvigrisea]OIV38542.1 hypothetical protein BIV57_05255 [Mangrovactinospora gilvigrisea]